MARLATRGALFGASTETEMNDFEIERILSQVIDQFVVLQKWSVKAKASRSLDQVIPVILGVRAKLKLLEEMDRSHPLQGLTREVRAEFDTREFRAADHGKSFFCAPKPEDSSSTSSEPKRKIDKRPWLKNKPNGSKLKPGQPHPNSLLTDELEEKIIAFVSGRATWSNACRLVGISLAAVEDWKSKGLCLPGSRYARFLEKAEKAVLECEILHVNHIAHDPDWKARHWLLLLPGGNPQGAPEQTGSRSIGTSLAERASRCGSQSLAPRK